MKVGLGADHRGFELKQQLAMLVAAEAHVVVDFGNLVYDASDDYTDFAIPLARAVSRGDIEAVFCCAAPGRALPWPPTRSSACARRFVRTILRPGKPWRTTV